MSKGGGKRFLGASLVRTIYEYQQLYAHRKDLQLAEEAAIFLEHFRSFGAGRLCRLVNYSQESLPFAIVVRSGK